MSIPVLYRPLVKSRLEKDREKRMRSELQQSLSRSRAVEYDEDSDGLSSIQRLGGRARKATVESSRVPLRLSCSQIALLLLLLSRPLPRRLSSLLFTFNSALLILSQLPTPALTLIPHEPPVVLRSSISCRYVYYLKSSKYLLGDFKCWIDDFTHPTQFTHIQGPSLTLHTSSHKMTI